MFLISIQEKKEKEAKLKNILNGLEQNMIKDNSVFQGFQSAKTLGAKVKAVRSEEKDLKIQMKD